MKNERISVEYIEHENVDGDDIAGVIVDVFNKDILIAVTERRGPDAEVRLNIEKAKELVNVINSAIELASKN